MRDNTDKNVSSISQLIFDKITSNFKQHATMMSVGSTGCGKSYAMIKICEELSKKLSVKYGETPDYYFNIEHIAIITEEEIGRVIGLFKKHGVYILDDIGVGANARKFHSASNIALNDVIETFRPNSNFLGITVPDSFLADKVQREMVHFYMEMNEPMYEQGYGVGTLYLIRRDLKEHITDYVTPINGYSYKKYLFPLASKELIDEYDRRRDMIYKELEGNRSDIISGNEDNNIVSTTVGRKKTEKIDSSGIFRKAKTKRC